MTKIPRYLKNCISEDIEEFGVEEGDINNLPRLISLLPEQDRESYRNRMREHVFQMTGNRNITWKQYMEIDYE